eukprot:6210105-Pleurochrysis_carterae.AAC.1
MPNLDLSPSGLSTIAYASPNCSSLTPRPGIENCKWPASASTSLLDRLTLADREREKATGVRYAHAKRRKAHMVGSISARRGQAGAHKA